MLRAGDLDQRVTFQRYAVVPDAQGGRAKTPAALPGLTSIAAQVTWDGADEAPRSDQLVAQRRGNVRVRYSSLTNEVTAKDVIVWSGRTLAILGVMPGGMRLREWFDFTVIERTS